MGEAAAQPLDSAAGALTAILPQLRGGDDVIRCLAARGLGALADEAAAGDLVEALLDEDPDVRSDAMAALVRCARPQDGEAIRRSLLGDPIKEVKLHAIEALAALGDDATQPLLRRLAKDRCEAEVAWEDDGVSWDDWLDIQVCAIGALGRSDNNDAIADILEARSDELGQDLDVVAFEALAAIGGKGTAALIPFARDSNARVRERALTALSKSEPDALAPWSAELCRDESPAVRCFAVACLRADGPELKALALKDPDATVRRTALRVLAPRSAAVVGVALQDVDEGVRAVALESLLTRQDLVADDTGLSPDDLAANLEVWLQSAGVDLAATAAAGLLQLKGSAAGPALCTAATAQDRPVEVRIAAIRCLGLLGDEASLDLLGRLRSDPIQQIRAAALAALGQLSNGQDGSSAIRAQALLAEAIAGTVVTPDMAINEDEVAPDAATPKEEPIAGRLEITTEGDIVAAAADHRGEAAFPQSTLDAIKAESVDRAESDAVSIPGRGEDTGRARGRSRRRVPVDGPSVFDEELRILALRIATDCTGTEIDGAVSACLEDESAVVRRAAFAAVARRSERADDGLAASSQEVLIRALNDEDPTIRGDAARALAASATDTTRCLRPGLEDRDPLVRAVCLKAVARTDSQHALAGLQDSSSAVRKVALDLILESGSPSELERALRVCLQEGQPDSLAEALKRKQTAQELLFSAMTTQSLSRPEIQVALEALSRLD